jgi:hypothetical protein
MKKQVIDHELDRIREVPVLGDTDGERRWFAMGYRLGMIRANEILQQMSKDNGEIVGGCPAGPYREAFNRVSAEIPKGAVKVSYALE